mgnify:CR=1 FL=1|tara:strand:+ start:381 stop:959 length:579 start_codon:yes stop_codon:yes gene_type:complete
MIDTDKRAFLEIMTMTGEIYNKKISTALLKMYFEALKQLSIADVENGIQKHLADTNQGGFFPKPSDIVRNSPQGAISAKEKGEIAWATVLSEIAKTGPYNKPRIEDRQALAAMRGLGGWVNLCNLSYEQLDWKKKEFFDLYETYEKAPLESLPSNLPGLVELQKHKAENNGGMKLISEALNNIKTTLDNKGE